MQASHSYTFSNLILPAAPVITTGGDHGRRRQRTRLVTSSWKRDGNESHDYGGRYVDESMIELRRRIHEMKMAEKNYEAPKEWMDWERRYFVNYGSDVTQIMALVQALLLNTRPSLGIGMVVLVALSVPVSMGFILFHFVDVVKHLFS
ncbi:hypothetical protein IHE45_05G135400 [Dioscorea alata]|uniref:Uncharacterized protein n=1 Tax=Dioscorea alata TaxID=55571 RepID=A0ACB7W5D4_DIOAL|nr:hypothetical protein IHE45_05G135400 [Dioscorea alata]